MFSLWWPTMLIPAWMLICGILGNRIKNNQHRSTGGPLSADQQAFADRQRHQLLLIYSLVFAGVAAVAMRFTMALSEGVQRGFMLAIILLQVAGVGLLSVPVERALDDYIVEQQKKGEQK